MKILVINKINKYHFFLKSLFLDLLGVIRGVDYTSLAGLAGMEIIFRVDFFLFFSKVDSGLFFCLILEFLCSFEMFLGV